MRSANFTVRLSSLGSAALTTQRPRPRKPKIAVAIRPRRPVEMVEGFMIVSLCFRSHSASRSCGARNMPLRVCGERSRSPREGSHWQLTVILLAHSRRCGRDSRVVSHRKPPLCAASCRRVVARWTAEPPSQRKYASAHAMIPMLCSPGLADPLREGAATVRCGLRTAGHGVLPGKPTGDTLQCQWTLHHMP